MAGSEGRGGDVFELEGLVGGVKDGGLSWTGSSGRPRISRMGAVKARRRFSTDSSISCGWIGGVGGDWCFCEGLSVGVLRKIKIRFG